TGLTYRGCITDSSINASTLGSMTGIFQCLLHAVKRLTSYIEPSAFSFRAMFSPWSFMASMLIEEHALRKWAVIILAWNITNQLSFPNVLPAVTFATKEFCADNAIAVIMVFIVQAVYANQFMRYTTPGAVFVVILALAAL
ncbi:hypothetical protein MPER_09945, partial [Moniliophthora perniciosa FA553]